MKDTPDLEIFLKIINQPLWDWAIIPGRDVRIDCPNQDAARDFVRNWYESIKIFTFNFDCDRALVRYPNCQVPFELAFRVLDEEARRDKRRSIHLGLMITPQTPNLTRFQTNIPGVGETIFPDFLQFLAEETRKGRFWVVSEFPSDRVLFLTDNTDPNWVKIPTHQIVGMDRMNSWRDSMDDYDRLQHLLVTDGVAPQFVNKGYRLDDSFCQFQATHYLIDGIFGTRCRACVSEGRELLRLPPDVK